MVTEEELQDLPNKDLYDTITKLSQDLQSFEHRVLNAMVKADHEKIMKELEREELNGTKERTISQI